jgi:hypothetical protein
VGDSRELANGVARLPMCGQNHVNTTHTDREKEREREKRNDEGFSSPPFQSQKWRFSVRSNGRIEMRSEG